MPTLSRQPRHVAAQQPQRLLGILERHLGMVVRHAVLEHRRRDALRGEPAGHEEPFVVHGQADIPAARADDDPLPGGFRRLGREEVQLGLGGPGDAVGLLLLLGGGDAVAVGRRGVVPDADGGGLPVVGLLCRGGGR